jgi:hypothetical protein
MGRGFASWIVVVRIDNRFGGNIGRFEIRIRDDHFHIIDSPDSYYFSNYGDY